MEPQGKTSGKPQTEDRLRRMGARIRALRIAKGFASYEDFAYASGISRSQIWRYENGEGLTITSLFRVVDALEVPLAEFFGEGF